MEFIQHFSKKLLEKKIKRIKTSEWVHIKRRSSEYFFCSLTWFKAIRHKLHNNQYDFYYITNALNINNLNCLIIDEQIINITWKLCTKNKQMLNNINWFY